LFRTREFGTRSSQVAISDLAVMPSDCSVGNAFGPLRDFFCKFAVAGRFVQCVWRCEILNTLHTKVCIKLLIRRDFSKSFPASSALRPFVSWPGPQPPRPRLRPDARRRSTASLLLAMAEVRAAARRVRFLGRTCRACPWLAGLFVTLSGPPWALDAPVNAALPDGDPFHTQPRGRLLR
jgi:hypothetical protein